MHKALTVYVPTQNNSFKIETAPLYNKVINAFVTLKSGIQKYTENYTDTLYMFQEKMDYAFNYGCNELIIDSKGAIFSNMQFLNMIFDINNQKLRHKFDYVAVKTAGENLNNETLNYLKTQKVREIVLKLTSHDTMKNLNLLTQGDKLRLDIKELCEKIKQQGFLLRIQFYLTKWFDFVTINDLCDYCNTFANEKITFKDVEKEKKFNDYQINTIDDFNKIINNLQKIGITNSNLPIHALNDNVSLVYDNRHATELYNDNHLYLFPDCHLYMNKTKCNSMVY